MQILCRLILISVVSLGLFRNEIKAPSLSPDNVIQKCVKTDRFIKANIPKKEIKVRITTYWAKGGDTDGWSAKRQSSTGVRLKPNFSVAVDPKVIPYFSRVYIPNLGMRVAHDTGTAVIRKKASGGKYPVIDVFFLYKKDAIRFANTHPKIVKVKVFDRI
jgi:3D (Asp-Asp-Asp) domain-containing protein